ncbi:hypothetical protein BFP70_19265 [Thioclava sp. SK-1]|uniref:ROK family transcriptional regulator n=1 Tax=Thioclava sp. SK-1 TaxID=1889770 RepID=UPI00082649C8|nr:ROK family transcriptional regulator [Thioclava sp. SK-1]OCX58195.1 hypothetical protein BFP70_19265 [Thioclava sp. SK-1]
MSMPSTVRHMNETRALETLLHNGEMSRADLARELNLTRSTASSIVTSLIENGHVHEITTDSSDAERVQKTGRPGIRLSLNADRALFLGADIAARRLRLCAVDLLGQVRHLETLETTEDILAPDEIVERMGAMIDRYVASVPDVSVVKGVNVSVPGLVDFDGNVLRAPPLGWQRVALRDLLQSRLSRVQVLGLVNDANAFAYADWQARGTATLTDAIYLLLDDGVGGCVVSGGKILQGSDGFAGEIGHMLVGEGGFCNLTNVGGVLENYISRRALLQRYRDLGGVANRLQDFLDALARDEPVAHQVAADWAVYLGRGLANLTVLLNPRRVILGGRGAGVLPFAGGQLTAEISAHLLPATPLPAVEVSTVGPEAPAVGVAKMLHRNYFALRAELSEQFS